MVYQLNSEEVKLRSSIIDRYYMPPIVKEIDSYIAAHGELEAFNYIHDILRDSQHKVETILQGRKDDGEISDVSQARKSVVGSAFTNCIIYVFLKNKEVGNVRSNIFITNRTKDKNFQKLVCIEIEDETQKPDMDLIIYSTAQGGEIDKFAVVSAKTSLRERAGQTYKWKLLMEIACTDNPIKDKYKIKYGAKVMPLVCFVTVNFYNEINNPQHRGMFKFFDRAFIGKKVDASFIQNMSTMVEYMNSNL
jgi:type II restriction enzyme